MNKRILALGPMLCCLMACDTNLNTSLVVDGVLPPEDPMLCDFKAGKMDFRLQTAVDVSASSSATLVVQLQNLVGGNMNQFEMETPNDALVYRNTVTPVNFDFRWECDSIGLAADLRPFFLPNFSLEQEFCLDQRDDTQAGFAGFDVVPAAGPAIIAQASSAATTTPVTPQMTLGMRNLFKISALVETCCMSNPNDCEQQYTTATAGECEQLRSFVEGVSGGTPVPFSTLRDRFLPYAIFSKATTAGAGTPGFPRFPLRLRGVFEGLTNEGSFVTSSELAHQFLFSEGGGSATCVE